MRRRRNPAPTGLYEWYYESQIRSASGNWAPIFVLIWYEEQPRTRAEGERARWHKAWRLESRLDQDGDVVSVLFQIGESHTMGAYGSRHGFNLRFVEDKPARFATAYLPYKPNERQLKSIGLYGYQMMTEMLDRSREIASER